MIRTHLIAVALFCGVAVAGTAAPAQAGNYTVLYAFQGGSDGANPRANLITVGGTLYGTTFSGGGSANCAGGCGTVFALNPTTGAEQVVHAFQAGSDGANPQAGLVNVGGTLYGTTAFGGGFTSCTVLGTGCGTVFALNPTTGAETVVYVFRGAGDGAVPYASLIYVGGALYGTTFNGGSTNCFDGCGTVFALNPTTGSESVVYTFRGGGDGDAPYASLINLGNTLYGTTFSGGGSDDGTVFSLNPTTGAEKVLHSFQSLGDGINPYASVLNLGGTLYGTTDGGGSLKCRGGCGAVFALNPTTGSEKIVHYFLVSNDGARPTGGLINVGGTLYGTTSYGGGTGCGGLGCGLVFALTP
jgi:uncharacterized repeat protein (TIGR03803 family)